MAAFLAPAATGGRSYLAPAVASAEAINVDLVLNYNVRQSISVDLVLAYNLGEAVSADLVLTYNVLETVSRDLVVTYNIVSEGNDMSFTPSAARTIAVTPGSKPFTAGELWNMSDPKKPRAPKDPDALTDYSFDWTLWLADVSDSIVTHDILTTEGLVNQGSSVVGSIATVFLSAGNPSKRAEVTCRISTNSTPPRVEDRTIFLDIESR